MSRAFVPAALSVRSLLARSPRVVRAFALACAIAAIAMPRVVAALPANAEVTIESPITITELDNLDFGNILAPTSGTQKFKIDESTGAESISGAGSGGQFLNGSHRGHYSIIGDDGPYTLTTLFGGCTDPVNLQLTAIAVDGTSVLDDDVYVGGTLQVKSTVLPGPYTCNYSLTASY
jgi:hypothetical protein